MITTQAQVASCSPMREVSWISFPSGYCTNSLIMLLGNLNWPFWTKLVVVAIGFTGGLVFMYVQCKTYVKLFQRWKQFNRVIYINDIELVEMPKPEPNDSVVDEPKEVIPALWMHWFLNIHFLHIISCSGSCCSTYSLNILEKYLRMIRFFRTFFSILFYICLLIYY